MKGRRGKKYDDDDDHDDDSNNNDNNDNAEDKKKGKMNDGGIKAMKKEKNGTNENRFLFKLKIPPSSFIVYRCDDQSIHSFIHSFHPSPLINSSFFDF